MQRLKRLRLLRLLQKAVGEAEAPEAEVAEGGHLQRQRQGQSQVLQSQGCFAVW